MACLDFRKTRMLTLTLDRAIAGQGEVAYLWYKENKPIGRFIQNLGRAGVSVEDWTSNLEWHNDGTPHFHLLIQVSKAGRNGQIGEKLIHRCWPYGRIHEYYFKGEKAFMDFLGYFGKTGYMHKDKRHQVILPDWAKTENWRDRRINRFSSMKRPHTPDGEHVEEDSGIKETEPVEKNQSLTYAERISKCGQETDLWIIGPDSEEEFIQRVPVPYRELVGMLDGHYVEGVGFAFPGAPWQLLNAVRAYASAYSLGGGRFGTAENGPPSELVGGSAGPAAPSTAPSSSEGGAV